MVLELTGSKILNLPPELLLLILGDLDDADLCALGCTCKDLNNFVFPHLFGRHIGSSSAMRGTISFLWRSPTRILRAVRCCLSTKYINSIDYPLDTGLDTFAEDVEDMHAIVARAKEIRRFEVYLKEPIDWGLSQNSPASLLSSESVRLYTELLTVAVTKGCRLFGMGGRARFVNTPPAASSAPGLSSQHADKRDSNTTRYFEGTSTSGERSSAPPRRSRRDSRLPPTSEKPAAPISKIEKVLLECDMLFLDARFFDWTVQFFSWCAPTLTRLELQSPSTSGVAWGKLFSKLSLPSLNQFKFAHATIHPSELLQFLSRHPSIQNLSLYHGIQLSTTSPQRLPRPILPRLESVTIDPSHLQWLTRDKKQCPQLKEVIFLITKQTFLHTSSANDNVLDKAFKSLLRWSGQVGVIGFHFQCVDEGFDQWLQSHVANGSDSLAKGSILSKFVGTKHLQTASLYSADIINPPTRLALVAGFASLFPQLEFLELSEQPLVGAVKKDDFTRVLDVLREHCPQIKTLKINHLLHQINPR